MLIVEKKEFLKGTVMILSFIVVLFLMFSPIFKGGNALTSADNLFNSISKGSTYYIPDLMKKSERFQGTLFESRVAVKDPSLGTKGEKLLAGSGIEVRPGPNELELKGALGSLLAAAIKDADAMFKNQGQEVAQRYGFPEREVLFTWWSLLKGLDKDLQRQKKFEEASFVSDVVKKGIELSYNYYTIEPEKASANMGILTFSLIFYVAYTLWWGLGIFYLFEGIGLKMKAGARKEV